MISEQEYKNRIWENITVSENGYKKFLDSKYPEWETFTVVQKGDNLYYSNISGVVFSIRINLKSNKLKHIDIYNEKGTRPYLRAFIVKERVLQLRYYEFNTWDRNYDVILGKNFYPVFTVEYFDSRKRWIDWYFSPGKLFYNEDHFLDSVEGYPIKKSSPKINCYKYSDIPGLIQKNLEDIVLKKDSLQNFISEVKSDEKVYLIYKSILRSDYILLEETDNYVWFCKRKKFRKLWQGDYHRNNDVYYTLEYPEDNKRSQVYPKKLIVIFSVMPFSRDMDNCEPEIRFSRKHFANISRSLIKDTYIMRIVDLNLHCGSFFTNTLNYSNYERDLQEAIKKVASEFKIKDENIVLYGSSKGGFAALYYSSLMDFKSLSADPVIDTSEYDNNNDYFYLKGLRKQNYLEDININLQNNIREKWIIGSENLEFNWNILKKLKGNNLHIMNSYDKQIKSHPVLSRNTIPEQLTILNLLLSESLRKTL